MDFDTFKKEVKKKIPVDTVLENPKKGTSTIMPYSNDKISYKRGDSTIKVSLYDLFNSYSHFRGQKVTSKKLCSYARSVYFNKECNCTFLFMVLKCIGLIDKIHGSGANGKPFFVTIPK